MNKIERNENLMLFNCISLNSRIHYALKNILSENFICLLLFFFIVGFVLIEKQTNHISDIATI
jgi:hypothetical protein